MLRHSTLIPGPVTRKCLQDSDSLLAAPTQTADRRGARRNSAASFPRRLAPSQLRDRRPYSALCNSSPTLNSPKSQTVICGCSAGLEASTRHLVTREIMDIDWAPTRGLGNRGCITQNLLSTPYLPIQFRCLRYPPACGAAGRNDAYNLLRLGQDPAQTLPLPSCMVLSCPSHPVYPSASCRTVLLSG